MPRCLTEVIETLGKRGNDTVRQLSRINYWDVFHISRFNLRQSVNEYPLLLSDSRITEHVVQVRQ
jgi:hypothetical protein